MSVRVRRYSVRTMIRPDGEKERARMDGSSSVRRDRTRGCSVDHRAPLVPLRDGGVSILDTRLLIPGAPPPGKAGPRILAVSRTGGR
jgi:hypothetical protein